MLKLDGVLKVFGETLAVDRVSLEVGPGETVGLLLDEPTASLDPDIADKVRKLVRKLQRDRNPAILYTSHRGVQNLQVRDRTVLS